MNRVTSAISSVDGTPMPTLVELSAFDPNWTNDFSVAEVLLRATLGKYVVSVDHIGSTAVPGLAAKPIIDIDITLSSLTTFPTQVRS